ncbi:MAG TPA: hypothetical protein VHO24_05945 [Opitutaceae bacterium]|nr:hypothetical protein [Opitutaceae bacterium]
MLHMPGSYRIDRNARVVFSAATGVFTAEDAWNQINQLLADPEFDPTFGQLLDFSNVGPVNLTPAEIKNLAGVALFAPTARRAFVSPTPLLYGLARMYAAQREVQGDTGLGVFHTMDEALIWLGLRNPPPVV